MPESAIPTALKTRILSLMLGLGFMAQAGAQTLYDGMLGSLPSSQGWNYITSPLFGAKAVQSLAGGLATLDTTAAMGDSAGYFTSLPPFFPLHPLVGVLDRTNGFTVDFDSTLISETHDTTNRAGLSVIVLASDLSGIELGFWEDQIWAQDDGTNLFVHAESVTFNTKAHTTYQLSIKDQSYTLSTNRVSLLTGRLRNYSSKGKPYSVPSFIFLGDDTSRASAQFQVGLVTLTKHLTRPRFEEVGLFDDHLKFTLSGVPGTVYFIDESEDFILWNQILEINNFGGNQLIDIQYSVKPALHFYRVRTAGNP